MESELPFSSNLEHDEECDCFACYEVAEKAHLDLMEALATGN